MIDLAERLMNTAVGVPGLPQYTGGNRASSLGHPCLRYLVYERTAWKEKRAFGRDTLLRFEEGNRHETHVLGLLREAGEVAVEQAGVTFYIPGQDISGRCDACLRFRYGDGWSDMHVAEVKSMAPYLWDGVKSLEDLQINVWTAPYAWQLTLYIGMARLRHKELPRMPGAIAGGLFILKNRSTGQIRILEQPWDEGDFNIMMAKASEINALVEDEKLPDRMEYGRRCRGCDYELLCKPEHHNPGMEHVVSGELVEACALRAELAPKRSAMTKEWEANQEVIKNWAKSSANPTVGRLVGDPPQWQVSLTATGRLSVKELQAEHSSGEGTE